MFQAVELPMGLVGRMKLTGSWCRSHAKAWINSFCCRICRSLIPTCIDIMKHPYLSSNCVEIPVLFLHHEQSPTEAHSSFYMITHGRGDLDRDNLLGPGVVILSPRMNESGWVWSWSLYYGVLNSTRGRGHWRICNVTRKSVT